MALFKILKGDNKTTLDSKTKVEGYAYVLKTGDDSADFYVDYSNSIRLKINKKADEATKATQDGSGATIRTTYYADVAQSGSTLTFKDGAGNTKKSVTLPNNDNKVSQSVDTAAKLRPVLLGYSAQDAAASFADVTNRAYYNKAIYVQPSTGSLYATKFVGALTGNADTATSATKATQDAEGSVIRTTYLATIAQTSTDNKAALTFTGKDGAGSAKTGASFTIPLHASNKAGLITPNAQTIYGNKTFDSNATVTVNKAGGLVYAGIQTGTDATARPIWFATAVNGQVPCIGDGFTYTPSTGNLTVSKINGFTTSDAAFEWNNSPGDNQVLPTARAISDSLHNLLMAVNAMRFRGTLKTTGISNAVGTADGQFHLACSAGDVYVVTEAGTYAGKSCHPGDLLICIKDNSSTTAITNTDWEKIQGDNNGYISLSTSATTNSNAIARFADATGRVVKNSSVTIDDSGNITIPSGAAFKGNATSATKDSAGNNISTTYVKKTGDTMSGTLIFSDITTSTEGIRINDAVGGWTALVLGDTLTSGKSTKTWSLHTYQGAFYLTHNGSSTSTDNTGILSCTAAGRWTLANGLNIGYQNTSYALSVNSFICQTWVRTVGATGWYNETYGGGWYMTDSTYIRNYGGREVYLNAQLGVDANIKLWASNRQIQRVSRDVTWICGRDSAILRETDSTGWHAIISCKTAAGSWDIGEYNNGSTFNDKLVFSWASDTNYRAGTDTTMTAIRFTKEGYIEANRVYNAVWNDYAEYRSQKEYIEPGRVVIEQDNGKLIKSTERLQKGGSIVSDTFGTAMGETDNAKTPIAVSGRVLAYTDAPRETFHAGDCVCTGPNGTVSKMTDEEEEKYPLRCIGIVSEIPDYETWGSEDNTVKVNGRIWIKVK